MSSKRTAFLFLIIALPVCRLYAQAEEETELEEITESVPAQEEDFDYSELTERLAFYRKHPLNLNTATREELQAFVFLNPVQIADFLNYRGAAGKLIEVQEIQTVPSFDSETVRKLLPFVMVSRGSGLKINDLKRKSESSLILNWGELLQKPKGYFPSDTGKRSFYTGSRSHLLTRYRYHYDKNLFAAFTLEKDAGERFFSKGTVVPDFWSGTISIKGEGWIKKFVAGDYSLQFGQGLCLWTGLSFGKGAAIASLARQYSGLKPYTSANESLFFRGVSSSVAFGKVLVTPFLSYRKLDAHQDSSFSGAGVTSLSQSGLHRSESEIKNHNSITGMVYGSNIEYTGDALRFGGVLYRTGFDKPFLPGKYLYNKFDFSGKSVTNSSVYYNYNWENVYFFGEAAHSLGEGFAVVNGAMAALSRQVSVVLLYRSYSRNFYSFFSQGISESTSGTPEKGFYSGLTITPNSKTEISLYADFFNFPWLRFGVDGPSRGYDLFAQFTYSPAKNLKLTLRYKNKDRPENDDEDQTVHYVQSAKRESVRAELEYVKGAFRFRNRVEALYFRKDKLLDKGFMLYQDIICKPLRKRISASMRYAIFDTDSYNSAVYAFENNLLYTYSVSGYQNSGTRFYLNAKYRISRNTDLSARYSVTSYINMDAVGSGPDQVAGRKKSDINMQVSIRF
ncbi:ComEA family DNA-binding protein [Pararcticibacter amylolyticus]|uniref:Helix-hairpin-helix domain-containing protein n=1 Tax=Pararcticibacter amylolyticus TaxID=2173175 RepID=A0A2U2PJY5_9SPHI|nr:helix-hairpin-helix domain-containing protein [Pararcticibacter amylolyticus]PWG81718.1 hypothetical protein DDR33_04950 [Pararcticibacter amylolyticus]